MDKIIALEMSKSSTNMDVLEFYRAMPFNYMASAEAQVAAIKRQNIIRQHYNMLEDYLVRPGVRVLDVGCGTGWLSLTFAHHYKAEVTGIDFNPVAIARAEKTAASAGLNVSFITTDLFKFEPLQSFNIVVSLGVLHHTDDCLAGIELCAKKFLAPGGLLFIGLYHAFGRKPFLDVFAAKKRAGNSEQEMLDFYGSLSPNNKAEKTLLQSWFRDQVLHPHETQHTAAEVIPLIQNCGLDIVATSVNDFAPITDINALYEQEKKLYDIGMKKLSNNEYYTGFFIIMARKKK